MSPMNCRKKSGDESEDEAHRDREEIQKMTDEFSEKIDELAVKKEEEIMEV